MPAVNSQWPKLDDTARHGLAGEFVNAVEPHSEADPSALLVQFLSAAGNAAGRSAHFVAEGDKHFLKLNTVLVGETSKGRKGTALGQVMRVIKIADERFVAEHVSPGLSTGEGLIWHVRDEITKREPIKERGRTIDFHEVISDEGVLDKRLLVISSEFAQVLRVIGRPGNTLSAHLRCAWDSGDLRNLTKSDPIKSTGSHISVIGHITVTELRKYLSQTEMANGFANRFLWVCVKRSKLLPDGGMLEENVLNGLGSRLNEVLEAARFVGRMDRSRSARDLWADVYPKLSAGSARRYGAVISRSEAQTMRLAAIYALLDQSIVIHECHLQAALAVWNYAEASAKWIFGEAFGDPTVDRILETLKNSPAGCSRSALRDLFSRHLAASEIGQALETLSRENLARCEHVTTGGRPKEVWHYTPE